MPTKKSTKRVIPNIDYNIRTFEDYNTVTNMSETKKRVFQHMIDAVKHGLATGKDKVELFRLQATDNVIVLPKDSWKNSVKNALRFYSGTEAYEKCIDCQELLNRL